MSLSRLYLDANATWPPLPEAIRAANEAMATCSANPSSPHAEGRRARATVTEARTAVANLVGAGEEQVVFTASGTEANVMALNGLALAHGVNANLLRKWISRNERGPGLRRSTSAVVAKAPAAFILETIQAEGGVNVASETWLRAVQELAHTCGALFIVDAA